MSLAILQPTAWWSALCFGCCLFVLYLFALEPQKKVVCGYIWCTVTKKLEIWFNWQYKSIEVELQTEKDQLNQRIRIIYLCV